GLWLPLAVSFELMMLEGPTVQGAIGRLPDPQVHLAAMGLALSLSLLVESPVIMLLATAIALVKDGSTFRALREFVVMLCIFCTACRLVAALAAVTLLTIGKRLPGSQVGACALMAGVLVEAVATTLFALPLVRSRITDHTDTSTPPLTTAHIWRFHAPLAAST